jgi:hypothetical protein
MILGPQIYENKKVQKWTFLFIFLTNHYLFLLIYHLFFYYIHQLHFVI